MKAGLLKKRAEGKGEERKEGKQGTASKKSSEKEKVIERRERI